MFIFLTRYYYGNQIHTDEPELFYKIYKWDCGLFTLISLRRRICAIILGIVGIIGLIFIKTRIYAILLLDVGMIILILETRELRRQIELCVMGGKTPAQIRTSHIIDFIRKYVSITGKALGLREWKEIKKYDIGLYKDLLSDNCDHYCYYYSLEIARIIKDSLLIWGAVEEPFEDGHKYYAHAIILRNGYIYDSNMRQSEKYEDFLKLYKFKIYKQWNYDEYSQEEFREGERENFREWCKKNNVLDYDKF